MNRVLQYPMSTPSISRLKKLRNSDKSGGGDVVDSSSISRLPDEIILQIFSRLSDLKTLCICHLVSKRFSSIVLEVDAITFTAPRLLNPPIVDKDTIGDAAPSTPIPSIVSTFYGYSLVDASMFLGKFRGVKSFCIEFPSSHSVVDNRYLLKWKVKFGSRVESIIILSPDSVCDNDGFYLNGNGDEEEDRESIHDRFEQKFDFSFQCMNDVLAWHKIFLWFVMVLPKLEKISITDSGKLGSLSLSGEKLNEVKEWVHSSSESVFTRIEIPYIWCHCKIRVLKLPVSGYVMKGIFCAVLEMKDVQGGNDFLKNSEDGFEDKEEAAYNEAMIEILEKHRGMMLTHNHVGIIV